MKSNKTLMEELVEIQNRKDDAHWKEIEEYFRQRNQKDKENASQDVQENSTTTNNRGIGR